jgi:hypothetical protein
MTHDPIYLVLALSVNLRLRDMCGRQGQVGSLAGAAHLLNSNAGVLRGAQRERKSLVDQKGKSSLDLDSQY